MSFPANYLILSNFLNVCHFGEKWDLTLLLISISLMIWMLTHLWICSFVNCLFLSFAHFSIVIMVLFNCRIVDLCWILILFLLTIQSRFWWKPGSWLHDGSSNEEGGSELWGSGSVVTTPTSLYFSVNKSPKDASGKTPSLKLPVILLMVFLSVVLDQWSQNHLGAYKKHRFLSSVPSSASEFYVVCLGTYIVN